MTTIAFRTNFLLPGEEEAPPDSDTTDPSIPPGADAAAWRLFKTLTEALQPDSETTTADVIDTSLKAYEDDGDYDLVDFICRITSEMPFDHPSHRKFAEIVAGIIKRLPNYPPPQWMPENTALEDFVLQLRRNLLDFPDGPKAREQMGEPAIAYANCQSFLVNMMICGNPLQASRQLAKAVDEIYNKTERDIPMEHKRIFITAATQWFLWDIDVTFDTWKNRHDNYVVPSKRWADWAARFRELAVRQEYGDVCGMANKAAGAIEKKVQSDGEPLYT